MHFYDLRKSASNPVKLVKIGPLWAWQNLWGYGKMILTKFWPWGMPWDLIYDHFCVHVATKVQILIDETFLTWPYGHLQGWFLVFDYWISQEKSNDGDTASGRWTFCKFVDFRLFILYTFEKGKKRQGKRKGKREGIWGCSPSRKSKFSILLA